MHQHINKNGRAPKPHPRFRGLRVRVDREREPVELKLRVCEALKRAVSGCALEDALAHAAVDSVRVSPVGSHSQVSPSPAGEPG